MTILLLVTCGAGLFYLASLAVGKFIVFGARLDQDRIERGDW